MINFCYKIKNEIDLFKHDLISNNFLDVLKYHELFYNKFNDDIKELYKIKAKKLNLISLFKKNNKLNY